MTIKEACKSVIFISIITIEIVLMGLLFMAKENPEIAADNYHRPHEGLYVIDRESIDVVYIGSSHMHLSISPEDIFMQYGITGFDLGSPNQVIWESCYYLEELFHYQSPKVVFVEVLFANELINDEEYNHAAIDPMRISKTKWKMMKTAHMYNPEMENVLYYIIPLLRYHDRWKELGRGDYMYFKSDSNSITKGHTCRVGVKPGCFNYESYIETYDIETMKPECEGYLNMINQMCKSHNAELVLMKSPTNLWSLAKYRMIKEWADNNDVVYLDFNADTRLRESVSIDFENDSCDGGNHLNDNGAVKMSSWIGNWIMQRYEFEDKRKNTQYDDWKADYAYYRKCVEEANDTDDY